MTDQLVHTVLRQMNQPEYNLARDQPALLLTHSWGKNSELALSEMKTALSISNYGTIALSMPPPQTGICAAS